MFDFRSDNVSGVCPEIMTALAAANVSSAPAYGTDAITGSLNRRFSDFFEASVEVFPVTTGTAANALAVAQMARPWNVVYCHRLAHIETSECGAPEFMTGGAKLTGLDGPEAKFDAVTLERRLGGALGNVKGRAHLQPAGVSLSQATERGTVYEPSAIRDIGAVCRARGLYLHMDGARFANAVAHLGCTPAEITSRAGIDILSFGATKNGAMAAEAVVIFDPALAEDFRFRHKRSGHLVSKQRFISVQLARYIEDDLWLDNARHANAMARRLEAGLSTIPGARVVHPVQANEVFAVLPQSAMDALRAAGFGFSCPEPDQPSLARFVTAFDTAPASVDSLVQTAAGRQGNAA